MLVLVRGSDMAKGAFPRGCSLIYHVGSIARSAFEMAQLLPPPALAAIGRSVITGLENMNQ